ncbi:MAG: PHB depolymerase family esterase [Pirellulaceae bacterium]|nr:PHB depolymerase family esterase [Pirellulaceae bacterium]
MKYLQSRVQQFMPLATKRSSIALSETSLSLDFPHRLFTPEHYEPNYAYPLVIWLHSQDSSEYELDSVMPHLSIRNYVALAIRGPRASQVKERCFRWGKSTSAMTTVEDYVLQAIKATSEHISFDRRKVFLMGVGAGGTLAQWLGMRNSQNFAGVVSFHGGFPRRSDTLVHWKAARKLPVLMTYGESSELCDADEVCRSLRNVHSAGLRYQFAQFATGDDLDTGMTSCANQFMMNLVADRSNESTSAPLLEAHASARFDKN